MTRLTPEQTRELIDSIHRAALARETKLRAEGGGDWKYGYQPKHDLVAKLNAISATNSVKGHDVVQQLDAMRAKTQMQKSTAFENAVGQQEEQFYDRKIDYYSSDPVRPQWGSRQQADWEASRGVGHTRFEGERDWQSIRPEQRGTVGARVRDDASEGRSSPALPVARTSMEHLSGAGRVESAKALEDRAFQQIKELLAARRTARY